MKSELEDPDEYIDIEMLVQRGLLSQADLKRLRTFSSRYQIRRTIRRGLWRLARCLRGGISIPRLCLDQFVTYLGRMISLAESPPAPVPPVQFYSPPERRIFTPAYLWFLPRPPWYRRLLLRFKFWILYYYIFRLGQVVELPHW